MTDLYGAESFGRIHDEDGVTPQFLLDLADRADDTLVYLNPWREVSALQSPTWQLASTSEDLRLLMHRILPDMPSDVIEEQIDHEEQHNQASRLLGATTLGFAVTIEKRKGSGDKKGQTEVLAQMSAMAYDFRTTKLGLALVTAYPVKPSSSDLINVSVLGYTVEGLAEMAIDHNKKWRNSKRNKLPVPLSYSG